MAGSGGMPAFASGARLAKRGRSIVAMPATANGGATSRIIGEAAAGTVITLPRYQADYIVTEYGIADLRACSINERAQALIQIAAPKFQEALLSNWRAIENLI
jgi:acyl-CoA hydrolase